MTSVSPSYTPLETLLLFQALRVDGLPDVANYHPHPPMPDGRPPSWKRISDHLRALPVVRADPSYDAERLSPTALSQLYLSMLKQEAQNDYERQMGFETIDGKRTVRPQINGDASPNPRKRKFTPPPKLGTFWEAAQHSHLIPQLVARLYARYREYAVRNLRDYERTHITTSRDVVEIQAGRWDERLRQQQQLQQQQQSHRPASAAPSPVPSHAARPQPLVQKPVDAIQRSTSQTGSPTPPPQNGTPAPKRFSQATIDAVINHAPDTQGSAVDRRGSSNTALPPLSEYTPHSSHPGSPAAAAGHAPQPTLPHAPSNSGMHYSVASPVPHQSPYTSNHERPAGPQQAVNQMPHPTASPRPVLPPPPGVPQQHIGSPIHPGTPAHQQSFQQYPPPNRQSVGPGQPPLQGYPPAGQAPTPGQYYAQQQYPSRRTSYQSPHPDPRGFAQQAPVQSGGVQLQPFYFDPANKAQPHQRPPHLQQQATNPQDTPQPARPLPYASYPNAPATGPRPPPQVDARIRGIVEALATPPRLDRKPLWKSQGRPPPMPVPDELPRPAIEPLSPKKTAAKPAPRSTRSALANEPDKLSATSPEPDSQPKPEVASQLRKSTRRRTDGRDQSPHSVANSSVDGLDRARTRSQSVSTAAGGSLQVPANARPGSSRTEVKDEPTTPAPDAADDEEDEADEAAQQNVDQGSATPASAPGTGRMTRRRRGTLMTAPAQPSAPSTKRKRQSSPFPKADDAAADDEGEHTPAPPRPTTVMATRNFAKMAATIMNDLTSHKHASYFSHPVRDRDASGYSEIVKQPQDLKSIRTQITQGSRTVASIVAARAAAAAADADSDGSVVDIPASGRRASDAMTAFGGSSSTIELDRSIDILPPRAIVNGAQLEKQVYKMLANAVMFNPGEDGLVADTREMFEDVEARMREWRGAERDVGGNDEKDVDAAASTATEEASNERTKRRKVQ